MSRSFLKTISLPMRPFAELRRGERRGATRYRRLLCERLEDRWMLSSGDQALDLSGSWALVGVDTAGNRWFADMVTQQTGAELTGHFDWDTAAHGALGYGREYFAGAFDPSAMTIHLDGQRVENAHRIITGYYDALVSTDGRLFYEGSWGGIGGIPSYDWSAALCDVIESTFDSDLEEWQLTADGTLTWAPTGGDPGGHARVDDWATGQHMHLVSPERFHGDWGWTGNIPAMLSVDIYLAESAGWQTNGPVFRISGPGGSAHLELSTSAGPSQNHWQTFVIPLEKSIWTVTDGPWNDLLHKVTYLVYLVKVLLYLSFSFAVLCFCKLCLCFLSVFA